LDGATAGQNSPLCNDCNEVTPRLALVAKNALLNGDFPRVIEILDRLTGSAYADTITVGTQLALVKIDSGDGDDIVTASNSSVEFNGGAGADRFVSGAAGDRFDGGDGFDTADYSQYASGITVTLGLTPGSEGSGPGGDVLLQVERVVGSAMADTITGSQSADALLGGGGNDAINGGAFAKGRNQKQNVKAVIEDVLGHGNGASMLPGQIEAIWASKTAEAGGLLFSAAEIAAFNELAVETRREPWSIQSLRTFAT